uniref:Uncharacterized protein n=1 Tax=Megaselia scalaris TaxID=36166 RepID=T1GGI9_MEGSC
MTELLFECYDVPSICYAIDSLCSYKRNNIPKDSLIVSFGYHSVHVIPVLNNKVIYTKVRRLNLGGFNMINYINRLMQLKYPVHLTAITLGKMEDLLKNHCSLREDEEQYEIMVNIWNLLEEGDLVSFNQALKENNLESKEELHKLMTSVKTRADRSRIKLSQPPQPLDEKVTTPSVPVIPSGLTAIEWVEEVKRKRSEIHEKKQNRYKRRQDLAKRRTAAAQERMRIISQLAKKEKGTDDFGMRDEDWDVYKLHVGLEAIKTPELLFQPSMMGSSEAGIAELIEFVLKMFTPEEQLRLANGVFLTGGCAKFPGLEKRISIELLKMRPFQTPHKVFVAENPSLDAWFGLRDLGRLKKHPTVKTPKL